MKKFMALVLTVLLCAGSLAAGERKSVKLLVIGNSFTKSLLTYLPQLVKAEGKHELLFANLYIGGCSLERHVKELEAALKNPEHRPYETNYGERKMVNLPDLITKEKWDVVSIQQSSPLSWKPESYQPYADKLIAYIRENAPQAEIVIQETWSYRCDSPRFAKWGIDQNSMYDALKKSYFEFAAAKHFRVIPTGDAVQYYRANAPVTFKAPSEEELKKFREPALPGTEEGDVVGKYSWRVPKKAPKGDKTRRLSADCIHLNKWGKYLQACVWYGFLFGEAPETVQYQPELPYPWMAPLCLKAAAQALEGVREFNAAAKDQQ